MGSADKLYDKYEIRRKDGQHYLGGKHRGCQYFVIDLTHDEFAIPAIRAYANACVEKQPGLSADLKSWLTKKAAETVKVDSEEIEKIKMDFGDNNTCIDCGQTIPEDDIEADPETGEGPLCPSCLESRGTDDSFDLGESDND
jgi:hypothetical protein